MKVLVDHVEIGHGVDLTIETDDGDVIDLLVRTMHPNPVLVELRIGDQLVFESGSDTPTSAGHAKSR